MFNIIEQGIEDKTWSLFDALLTIIGCFESSKFVHKTFFRTHIIVHFLALFTV